MWLHNIPDYKITIIIKYLSAPIRCISKAEKIFHLALLAIKENAFKTIICLPSLYLIFWLAIDKRATQGRFRFLVIYFNITTFHPTLIRLNTLRIKLQNMVTIYVNTLKSVTLPLFKGVTQK